MDFSLDGYLTKHDFLSNGHTFIKELNRDTYVGLGYIYPHNFGMAKAAFSIPKYQKPIARNRRKQKPQLSGEFQNVIETQLMETTQKYMTSPHWKELTILTHGYAVHQKPPTYIGDNVNYIDFNLENPEVLLVKYGFEQIAMYTLMLGKSITSKDEKYLGIIQELQQENPSMKIVPHLGILDLELSADEFKEAIQLPEELYKELYL